MDTILSIQPRDIGGSSSEGQKSTDEIVDELCSQFEVKLPQIIKQDSLLPSNKERPSEIVSLKPINQLIVCLDQECARFNTLLGVIQKSLAALRKALKGETIMSAELDQMYLSLINNQVPDMWKNKSYPSLKPLSSWYDDLIQRVEFFRGW